MSPESRGAPDARAMPRQRGSATRNTTTDAAKSVLSELELESVAVLKTFLLGRSSAYRALPTILG
jgi:hypothetical protein